MWHMFHAVFVSRFVPRFPIRGLVRTTGTDGPQHFFSWKDREILPNFIRTQPKILLRWTDKTFCYESYGTKLQLYSMQYQIRSRVWVIGSFWSLCRTIVNVIYLWFLSKNISRKLPYRTEVRAPEATHASTKEKLIYFHWDVLIKSPTSSLLSFYWVDLNFDVSPS